jgi:hypothetical protein
LRTQFRVAFFPLGVIEISTASFRTTRGCSFAAVLCDEIAFWRQE